MEKKEVSILQELMAEMQAMTGKVSAIETETKETNERVRALESKTLLCQTNPSTCSTARKLDEYIARQKGKTGQVTGIIACIISCAGFAVNGIIAIVKGAKA